MTSLILLSENSIFTLFQYSLKLGIIKKEILFSVYQTIFLSIRQAQMESFVQFIGMNNNALVKLLESIVIHMKDIKQVIGETFRMQSTVHTPENSD